MTDQKVLVFGSFTEDEVKSLKIRPSKKNMDVKFGSVDSSLLKSLGFYETKSKELDYSKDSKYKNEESSVAKKSNGNGNILPQKHSVTALSTSLNGRVISNTSPIYQADLKKSISYPTNGYNRYSLPRGLVNLGNLCFLNATIQALLSCSPFVQLIHELTIYDIPKTEYPTLHSFVEFMSEFHLPFNRRIMEIGRPLRPLMFQTVLELFTPDVQNSLCGRPRQEDAQEFLSFVMHQMHDELLKLDGQYSNGTVIVSDNDEETEDYENNWETIGPKNTRTQSFVPSKLSAIFGGQLRSVVKAKGNKISATIEPFLLLHLNICPDFVYTIEDALRLFCAPETLEGYKISSAGKTEVVSAIKSMKILQPSKIMVLHLMRFTYGSQGSIKLLKPVHFPLEFSLGRDLLVSSSSQGIRYELVATITHHGGDYSRGHYTADAKHPSGTWLRYDDAAVTPILVDHVLHDQAYVLFYRQL